MVSPRGSVVCGIPQSTQRNKGKGPTFRVLSDIYNDTSLIQRVNRADGYLPKSARLSLVLYISTGAGHRREDTGGGGRTVLPLAFRIGDSLKRSFFSSIIFCLFLLLSSRCTQLPHLDIVPPPPPGGRDKFQSCFFSTESGHGILVRTSYDMTGLTNRKYPSRPTHRSVSLIVEKYGCDIRAPQPSYGICHKLHKLSAYFASYTLYRPTLGIQTLERLFG